MLKIPTQILYQATVLLWSLSCVRHPQLELQSAGPSTPSIIVDNQGNVIDSRDGSSEPIQFVFEDIHWTSEISRQEAARRLDVTFYPFKKVSIRWGFIQCSVSCGRTNRGLLFHFAGVLPAVLRGLWASWGRKQTGAFHSALGSTGWPVLLRWAGWYRRAAHCCRVIPKNALKQRFKLSLSDFSIDKALQIVFSLLIFILFHFILSLKMLPHKASRISNIFKHFDNTNVSFCCLSALEINYFKLFILTLLHLCRFGANSPGDRPGKFARPGLAQPELH